MVYDAFRSEEQAKQEHDEYVRDPEAWLRRKDALHTTFMRAFLGLYVCIGTYVLVEHAPSAHDIDQILQTRWFPYIGIPAAALFGGSLYWLKRKSRAVFGGTELIFALASAIHAVGQLAQEGLGAWAVAGGVIYLFAKGIENTVEGLFTEPRKVHPVSSTAEDRNRG